MELRTRCSLRFQKFGCNIGWPAPFAKPSVKWSGAPEITSESIPQDPPCDANLPEAGEDAAWKVWENFRDTALDLYNETRNNPDIWEQASCHRICASV
jgi:deoxyribodipyrimidine photolyase